MTNLPESLEILSRSNLDIGIFGSDLPKSIRVGILPPDTVKDIGSRISQVHVIGPADEGTLSYFSNPSNEKHTCEVVQWIQSPKLGVMKVALNGENGTHVFEIHRKMSTMPESVTYKTIGVDLYSRILKQRDHEPISF